VADPVAMVGQPRFNHVAMSMPAEALNAEGRSQILAFYSEVFGWQELPTETIDRRRLVMSVYRLDQFVFLIANDEPMQGPRMDHFGLGVATEAELDTFYERAKRFRERDPRVDIIDKHVDEFTSLSLTSFYVRYLLPMMVEVQYWSWGFQPPLPETAG
jgi:hypothetical protein